MQISALDLFNIGIGPSSSHTVGPMRAAARFGRGLLKDGLPVVRLRCELFGSLGHTGKGHGTDRAILLGLLGHAPETVEIEAIPALLAAVTETRSLRLLSGEGPTLVFDPTSDLIFHRREKLAGHPNGMRFSAFDEAGEPLRKRAYFSIGGGFVVDGDPEEEGITTVPDGVVPHPFASGEELLLRCRESGKSLSTVVLENERARRPTVDVHQRLLTIWAAMDACIRRGCEQEGILPGGLKVRRRAAAMARRLRSDPRGNGDPLASLDWLNLFALAVNEENAAGGRVVTAPTNGAAGIVPAVLSYYRRHLPGADDEGTVRFLLAAGAIGVLFKLNASISGAEVGCQGEVGVACSMAAAGLVEALGGTPEQVENAAEIGMEHNLGLTCDPVGGLVQVPCIERNAMGAVKALNAARLALSGDGRHAVSLDRVIRTMRETGRDMSTKYKETARGGLALNVVAC
jgi:L-serine dehydratase